MYKMIAAFSFLAIASATMTGCNDKEGSQEAQQPPKPIIIHQTNAILTQLLDRLAQEQERAFMYREASLCSTAGRSTLPIRTLQRK